jgi:hypothetical protein
MFNFGGGFPGGMPHGHGGGGRERKPVDTTGMYKELMIEKTATQAEVKKAFRKAAMKHHPDKGGDPEKFAKISNAYEILGDAKKRALYDEHGVEGVENGGGGGGGGGGMGDIFEMFGGGGGGRGRGRRQRRGEDVVFPLKVSLEDLYNGTTKQLRLTRNKLCTGCDGKGSLGDTLRCRGCKGQGVKIVIRQLGPGMIQQMQAQCGDCKGEGQVCCVVFSCCCCGTFSLSLFGVGVGVVVVGVVCVGFVVGAVFVVVVVACLPADTGAMRRLQRQGVGMFNQDRVRLSIITCQCYQNTSLLFFLLSCLTFPFISLPGDRREEPLHGVRGCEDCEGEEDARGVRAQGNVTRRESDVHGRRRRGAGHRRSR